MNITQARRFLLGLTSIVALTATAWPQSTGRMKTDGTGCPSIGDHQRFIQEIEKGNYSYRYPAECAELPPGTRIAGPVQRKEAAWGNSTAEFVLIEIEGGRKLWTLASWVDFDAAPVGELGPSPVALSESSVWFARELRRRFGDSVPLSGRQAPAREIACLPLDITRFAMTARASGGALVVEGSLTISALPSGFSVVDGAQGRRYMVQVVAYLFSPAGDLVWEQTGYPIGGAWISAAGETVRLRILNSLPSRPAGHELLLVAVGNPVHSDLGLGEVLIGAKRLQL